MATGAGGGQFTQIVTEKLMTYAVGRPVDFNDMPSVRRIVHDAKSQNSTFESIVLGVVNSDAFRRRAPAAPAPALKTASIDSSSTGGK